MNEFENLYTIDKLKCIDLTNEKKIYSINKYHSLFSQFNTMDISLTYHIVNPSEEF